MARIRECDRCKATYKPYEDGFNTIGTTVYNMDNEMIATEVDHDLCPRCKSEFKSWFEAHGNKLIN